MTPKQKEFYEKILIQASGNIPIDFYSMYFIQNAGLQYDFIKHCIFLRDEGILNPNAFNNFSRKQTEMYKFCIELSRNGFDI